MAVSPVAVLGLEEVFLGRNVCLEGGRRMQLGCQLGGPLSVVSQDIMLLLGILLEIVEFLIAVGPADELPVGGSDRLGPSTECDCDVLMGGVVVGPQ